MKIAHCGIWIDNAEAIVVRFGDDGEAEVSRIESGVGSRSKPRGGTKGSGKIGGVSHKKSENRRLNQFSSFFGEVWNAVADAEKIVIVGPGTAKQGFEAEVRGHHRHPEILAVDARDNLTDPQLVAEFRNTFGLAKPD